MNGVAWYDKGHKSKSLETLLKAHDIKRERTHRGLADAQATLTLIQQTDEETGEPFLDELLNMAYKVNSIFKKSKKEGLLSRIFN